MEHLQEELDLLLAQLPNESEVRDRLESLVSVYPFNEYEYIISTLLAMDALTLDGYHELRDNYIARNLYLYVFEISAPRTFGEAWAQGALEGIGSKASETLKEDRSRLLWSIRLYPRQHSHRGESVTCRGRRQE